MSTNLTTAHILNVQHWTDTQFTLTATRPQSLRFENGQFLMLGLELKARPLLRAYSIASANHEDHLQFLSVKVPGGPLTSQLQHVRAGDPLLISKKATGTLLLSDLRPGRRLYLLCTGTGLAPFMSVMKDPDIYDRFERVILVHGVRWRRETVIADHFIRDLGQHPVLGPLTQGTLCYYPCITREPHENQGRLTAHIASGKLGYDLGLPALDPTCDRAMVCGSPGMLAGTARLLDSYGFQISPHIGEPGDYVIERAFVER